ncbi:MAG TPA: amidohydrolase family protein [Stellaceae bacterium]|nr:amidohydrolase family protein [Stellaceae bacterium]
MPADGSPRIIDTHHHIYPPNYAKAHVDRLIGDTPTLPASAYTGWTPHFALEQMEKAGIASALGSMTSPGIWFDDGAAAARARARDCNEFGARMASDFPGRFGMFAAIPLPDTDGSLAEIAYAFDVLKLDGVGVLTSYEGKLLGDPAFAPVFDELNRRKAKVFVHPTMSCGLHFPGIASPVIEFPTDTARTIVSLIFSGTASRCADITFIFSHGGGILPMVVQRFGRMVAGLTPEQRARMLPQGLEHELRRQYYDLASVGASPVGMTAVLKLLPVTQLTYGSDAPFGSATQIADGIAKLGLAAADLRKVQRENALRLFPRFA